MKIITRIIAAAALAAPAASLAQDMSCAEAGPDGFIPAEVVAGRYRASLPYQPDGCMIVVTPGYGRPPEMQAMPKGIVALDCPGGDNLVAPYHLSEAQEGCMFHGNAWSMRLEMEQMVPRGDLIQRYTSGNVPSLKLQNHLRSPTEACEFMGAAYMTENETLISTEVVNDVYYPLTSGALFRGVCVSEHWNSANFIVRTPMSFAMYAVTGDGQYVPESQAVETVRQMVDADWVASFAVLVGPDGLAGQPSAISTLVGGLPDMGGIPEMHLERIEPTGQPVE